MKLLKTFKEAANTLFIEWGFRDAGDYVQTIFGFKGSGTVVTWQAVLGVLATIVTFISDWIWNPPLAYFLLITVILLDAWYGYQVAVKLKGERFSMRKGYRTFSVIIAHTLQLFFFYNITTKVYPAAVFVAHGVFIYIITYKTKSWLQHLVLLKLQEKGLIGFLSKLISSKLGADFIDAVNRNYDEKEKEKDDKKHA